ncbi:YjgP/YjgQ family permease [bacterium]|nr:MAG: YjgP/YjgQ family permease [bacterium]
MAPAASHPLVPARKAPRGSFFRLHALDFCYAREMIMPMSLGLIVLVLVMAGNFVYWAINSIVNQGMSILPVLKLFILAAPGFAVQGIPAGTILGVCLVLNRAVRDNEILALRAGGASLPRIVAPFLFMALVTSAIDYVIVEHVAPITNDRAEKTLARLMSQNSAPFIDSDRYFRAGPYYFYVGRAQNGLLQDVMIYQRADTKYTNFAPTVYPVVMIAKTAHENPEHKGQWILENGFIHTYDATGTQQSQNEFKHFTINIEQQLNNYFGTQKQPFSMTGSELSQKISDLKNAATDAGQINTLMVDYWRRMALPAACFVMALVAAPLALKYARHGSFAGLVAAFLLAFLWQGFDGWFRALGIAGYIPPLAAAWATNAIFMVAGAVLLVRER